MTNHPIEAARESRRAKTEAIAQLADGSLRLSDALRDRPAALHRADLWDVLLAVPGLGRASVRVICERANIWPHATFGSLSISESQRLCEAIPPKFQ